MKFISNWMCAGVLIIGITATAHAQELIEVFTDSSVPVDAMRVIPGVDTVYYDLSEPDSLKRAALPPLPPDERQAMKIIQRYFASSASEAFKRDMLVATQGRRLMIQYQLKKIPAIVFDHGAYVIYGTFDVAGSVGIYREHRNREGIRNVGGKQ